MLYFKKRYVFLSLLSAVTSFQKEPLPQKNYQNLNSATNWSLWCVSALPLPNLKFPETRLIK